MSRESQRQLMQEKRAVEQSVVIPAVANPERRLKAEACPFVFNKIYFEDEFDQDFTVNQIAITGAITQLITESGDQAIAAPRGEGKTTTGECTTGVYAIVKGLIRFAVIVGATARDAGQVLENIKRRYEFNELLIADFPEVCAPIMHIDGSPQRAGKQKVNGERTRICWAGDRIIFPTVKLAWCPKCYYPEPMERKEHLECPKCKETFKPWASKASGAILTTRGMDAAVRGLKVGSVRPDFILIDDPETEDSARSDDEIIKRSKRIDKDLGGLGKGNKKASRLMLTTIQTTKSLSAKYTDPKVKSSWNGMRQRLVLSWPENKGHWQQYCDIREDSADRANVFYDQNFELMNAGVEVTNPHRFDTARHERTTIQSVYNDAVDKGWDYVHCELQNDPQEEENTEEDHLTINMVMGGNFDYQTRLNGFEPGMVPAGTEWLTAAIDVQRDRLYFEVNAWRGNRRHVVDYGCFGDVISGDGLTIEDATSLRLQALKAVWDATPYETKEHQHVRFDCVLVDSGDGISVKAVYEFCILAGSNWFPSKGDGKYRSPQNQVTSTTLKGLEGDPWHFSFLFHAGHRFGLVLFNPNVFKHRCKAAWRAIPSGDVKNSIYLFGDSPLTHREYAKQICSAKYERRFVPGKGWREEWFEGRNNHYWDTSVLNIVALSVAQTMGIQHEVISVTAAPEDSQSENVTRQPVRPEQAVPQQRPDHRNDDRERSGSFVRRPSGRFFKR